MKRTILSILLCAAVFTVSAYDFVLDGIRYNYLTDSTVELASRANFATDPVYTGSFIVPSTITYHDTIYTVTAIGNNAFDRSEITSVTIPATVKVIKQRAFAQSARLNTVVLAEGLDTIGYYAFGACENLKNIVLPTSLKDLDQQAFSECAKLQQIVIPEGITTIKSSTFASCSALTDITLPSTLTTIDTWAFSLCKKLTDITIPQNVTTIAQGAFKSCYTLENVICEATTLPTADVSSFDNPHLKHLYVPYNSMAAYAADEVWGAFRNIHAYDIDEVVVTDSTTISPTETSVTFTWQKVDGATVYLLQIAQDTLNICTLRFDNSGRLIGITHAPSKEAKFATSPQQAETANTANGYQYTIYDLSANETYNYTLQAFDAENNLLAKHSGQFETITTALNTPTTSNTTNITNTTPYNLLGQPVPNTYPGIIIHNGQKILRIK